LKEGSINVKIVAYAVLYIVISVSRSGMPRPILAHKAGGLDYQKGIPVGDLDCKDILCSAGCCSVLSSPVGRIGNHTVLDKTNSKTVPITTDTALRRGMD
jgi:hypothetical protein